MLKSILNKKLRRKVRSFGFLGLQSPAKCIAILPEALKLDFTIETIIPGKLPKCPFKIHFQSSIH